MIQYVRTHANDTADDIAAGVYEAARSFGGCVPQQDDITSVIVKVTSAALHVEQAALPLETLAAACNVFVRDPAVVAPLGKLGPSADPKVIHWRQIPSLSERRKRIGPPYINAVSAADACSCGCAITISFPRQGPRPSP